MRVESEPDSPKGPRPRGIVQPSNERAQQALEALAGGYVRTAETHTDAMTDLSPADEAWLVFLRGLLATERGDLSDGESLLMQAASKAPTVDLGGGLTPRANSLRLAARALEKVGCILRRQDRPNDAYQVHSSAYHLRNEHGSHEEVWESAASLGMDSHLARRESDCRSWHRIAVEAAALASEEPEHKQALSWTSLSSSLTASGEHDEAVEAARTARRWWLEFDRSAVTAAKADVILGHALLKRGENMLDQDNREAKEVLAEASRWLESAHEALSAFGPGTAGDVRWCEEQIDFASRLRRTLE